MTDEREDHAEGLSDILAGPWGIGAIAAVTGGDRGANPHLGDSLAEQEWLRGFEAWGTALKVTIELPGVTDG